MLLYIIRHGDPIYNPDSLTEKGHKQAEALSRRLAKSGINAIYSSPNGRAMMTAEPTVKLLGLECLIEDWMSENHAWNEFSVENSNGGRNWAFHVQNTKIKKDAALIPGEEWYNASYLNNSKAKEGYNRIAENSDDFLSRLGYNRDGDIYAVEHPNDGKVAAFCHQGFGTVWLSYLLAIPPHYYWSNFDLSHSSVTILEFKNNRDGCTAPKCLCLSDMSHIYESGMTMSYNNYIDI